MLIHPVHEIGAHETNGRSDDQELDAKHDRPDRPSFRREAFVLTATGVVCAVGFVGWLIGASPARALSDNAQLLIGEFSLRQKKGVEGQTWYTAPGRSLYRSEGTVGPGKKIAYIRIFRSGVLGKLWMNVRTEFAPTGGSLTTTVMINGSDTSISCQVFAPGQCRSGAIVNVQYGDRLTIRVDDDFVDPGGIEMGYTLLFD